MSAGTYRGKPKPMSTDLTPNFDDVQSHYDLSDDFYRLFLDPSQTYSCAYFERDDMTLEEAQLAKIGLTLSKNQAAHAQKSLDELDNPRSKRVLLEGWEQFPEPVDRIVSIGAFE